MNWPLASWAIFALALAWPAWFAGRRLARRWRRRRRCEACAYDLRGRASDRCPECGQDVTKRVRLIRWRTALVHGLFVIVLLTASHLLNRIEAIQKRGWIAAVPTTVLIVCLPLERGPDDYSGSLLVGEVLRFRACREGHIDPKTRVEYGPTYPMTRWQWWCAIEMALRAEFTVFGSRTHWTMTAEWLLNAAESSDAATPDQLRRIRDVVVLEIRTRPEWPAGVEVHADFGILSIDSGWYFDFMVSPVAPNEHLASFHATGSSVGTYPDWSDHTKELGVAGPLGPVQYAFVVLRRDDIDEPWREHSRRVRAITTIVPADKALLNPIAVPSEVVGGIGVRMKIFDESRWAFEPCYVFLNLAQNQPLIDAIGDGTFAVQIRLKKDGEIVGEKVAWFNRLSWASSPDRDEWIIEFDAADELLEQSLQDGDSGWSLEIEGNPNIALRDFESTSYWAGTHEFRHIPVERVQP